MKDFARRIAIVSSGGLGMGRELVRQLVVEAVRCGQCERSPRWDLAEMRSARLSRTQGAAGEVDR